MKRPDGQQAEAEMAGKMGFTGVKTLLKPHGQNDRYHDRHQCNRHILNDRHLRAVEHLGKTRRQGEDRQHTHDDRHSPSAHQGIGNILRKPGEHRVVLILSPKAVNQREQRAAEQGADIGNKHQRQHDHDIFGDQDMIRSWRCQRHIKKIHHMFLPVKRLSK